MRTFLNCIVRRFERKEKKHLSGNDISIYDSMEANKGRGICQAVEFLLGTEKSNWPHISMWPVILLSYSLLEIEREKKLHSNRDIFQKCSNRRFEMPQHLKLIE